MKPKKETHRWDLRGVRQAPWLSQLYLREVLPQFAGASDLLELLYEKRGGKNGCLLSPLMTSTYLFPVLCVSVFAINDYYSPHGVKFIQG